MSFDTKNFKYKFYEDYDKLCLDIYKDGKGTCLAYSMDELDYFHIEPDAFIMICRGVMRAFDRLLMEDD